MKRFFLLALATAFATTASAEGYQVNTLSAKQLGMAHTGVSQKLGSESLWFNPAGAAFQEQKFTIAAGVTGIAATATYTPMDDYSGTDLITEKSDNDLSTPMYFNMNYKVNDNLAVGVLFNTPFGSSMNWGDNWSGAHLVQSISLQAYNLQPTISYRFLNDKLSIGAGLMMSWGTFDLSRSLFRISDNSTLAAALKTHFATSAEVISNAGNNALVSAELGGDAGMQFGYNIGVMYDINKQWSIGASYRGKIDMKVDSGEAELNYYSSEVETAFSRISAVVAIPAINVGTFSASLPLPATLSVGATYRPTEDWEIATEFQWVQWSAYESLDVLFHDPSLDGYSINAAKNYSNTMIARVGAQYTIAEWIDARLGLYVDESPVASDYLNPETPSMTKVGYTGGLSIRPIKDNALSIDLSYGYISAADPERAGSYPYENVILSDAQTPFVGNYTTKAHTFAVGLSWGF